MDAAALLQLFNEKAGRASSDQVDAATKYRKLSQGQQRVVGEIAAIYPQALYAAPAAMTTTDRKVYTFGTSGGEPIVPDGVKVYHSLNDVPDDPYAPGVDYLDEGTQIRWPNNRTGPATLYYQGIPPLADIAADSAPSLQPKEARELIVIRAVELWAAENNRRPDLVDAMRAEWASLFPVWMLRFRKRFRHGGALGSMTVLRAATMNPRIV